MLHCGSSTCQTVVASLVVAFLLPCRKAVLPSTDMDDMDPSNPFRANGLQDPLVKFHVSGCEGRTCILKPTYCRGTSFWPSLAAAHLSLQMRNPKRVTVNSKCKRKRSLLTVRVSKGNQDMCHRLDARLLRLVCGQTCDLLKT